jgi:hypothetical protein
MWLPVKNFVELLSREAGAVSSNGIVPRVRLHEAQLLPDYCTAPLSM